MNTGTLTSKGQITLPAHLRVKYRLDAGTKVTFEDLGDGRIAIRPRTGDIRALAGMAGYAGPPVSLEDMDRAIVEAVSARLKRTAE